MVFKDAPYEPPEEWYNLEVALQRAQHRLLTYQNDGVPEEQLGALKVWMIEASRLREAQIRKAQEQAQAMALAAQAQQALGAAQ
jgi:hypothetical protein